ncbi:MAG: ABC transporter permease [Pseudomonadota bacterium]
MTNPTGLRGRTVRRSVLLADKIADYSIRIGGALVIAAVLGILVFLVYEVVPLFQGGTVTGRHGFSMPGPVRDIVSSTMDEYKTVAVVTAADGSVKAFHAKTGTMLKVSPLDLKGKTVTATATTMDRRDIAYGFSDGTVRFARISMDVEVMPAGSLPTGLKKLDDGDLTDGPSVFSHVPGDQVRKVTVKTRLSEEVKASRTGDAVIALDYRAGGPADKPQRTFVTVDGGGKATLNRSSVRKNLLTGKVTESVSTTDLPALPRPASIVYALVTDTADQVYLAERSGRLYRYDTSNPENPVLAETHDVTHQGNELTCLGFLLGDQSLVVGDSSGRLVIYFRLRREHTGNSDGHGMVLTRKFEPMGSAVTAIQPSRRGRVFLATDRSGDIRVLHATSQKTLFDLNIEGTGGKAAATALAPRDDGVLVVRESGETDFLDLNIQHPETSLEALFGKVWYEGYPEPTYTWQSSGAGDDFEPKLSLIPLIFGTLKATLYSLIFAIPVALLAAVYTSEFTHPSVRATVKPIMELMASLPSVILGFVAALVLAPVVESWIAAVVLSFVVVPLSFILAAHLWQLLPTPVTIRLQGLPKLIAIGIVLTGAFWISCAAAPGFERLFFAGDFIAWVNGGAGSAAPFLFLLLMPPVAFCTAMLLTRLSGAGAYGKGHGKSALNDGLLQMARLLGILIVSAGVSYGLALALQSVGIDARGTFVGTYVQRNTLIVGFAMGFAVIPIIYTLAEDALNSVPDHLRSASLACGATPWQTAMWVILPTAISGVFSAIMIGMGRAVGETMIVVMAAGNTPLIDLNIFNGLRALSANIAVELPEAVKDGSLYRVLFLTALVLFSMTFVINTFAEAVRMRFRKRTMQL